MIKKTKTEQPKNSVPLGQQEWDRSPVDTWLFFGQVNLGPNQGSQGQVPEKTLKKSPQGRIFQKHFQVSGQCKSNHSKALKVNDEDNALMKALYAGH